jgi:hypothetical protein
MENERIWTVKRLLSEYLKSPSLRHIRDDHQLHKLAKKIVREVSAASTVWKKWDADREVIVKASVPCWIPIEDLLAFLNSLPGPPLTRTDAEQRLREFREEPYSTYPNEAFKEGCLALYNAEKEQGTEMRAIIGALEEHIEAEEDRFRQERDEEHRRFREKERLRLQQFFLSGADCAWTPIDNSEAVYCRKNGRAFRLQPVKNKLWKFTLFGIKKPDDEGVQLGTYQYRGEATKAVKQLAYAKMDW